MFELTKLFGALILPPGNVLILWLFALLCWLFRCKKMAALSTLLGISILYIFSTHYMTEKLNNNLVQEDNLSIEDYRQAQAIVLLGGGLRDSQELYYRMTVPGIALERMRYAAYLHKETELPILISGATPNGNSEAKVMGQELFTFFGVQSKWLENKARNTKENAQFSREILQLEGINKIILVTNQWHMQRAKLLFERSGFQVLPASIGNGVVTQYFPLSYMHFIPNAAALNANTQLLKEWLGYWKERF